MGELQAWWAVFRKMVSCVLDIREAGPMTIIVSLAILMLAAYGTYCLLMVLKRKLFQYPVEEKQPKISVTNSTFDRSPGAIQIATHGSQNAVIGANQPQSFCPPFGKRLFLIPIPFTSWDSLEVWIHKNTLKSR